MDSVPHFDAVQRDTGHLQRDSSQERGAEFGWPWCNLPMTVGRPTRTAQVASPLHSIPRSVRAPVGGICVCVFECFKFSCRVLPLVTLSYGRPGNLCLGLAMVKQEEKKCLLLDFLHAFI